MIIGPEDLVGELKNNLWEYDLPARFRFHISDDNIGKVTYSGEYFRCFNPEDPIIYHLDSTPKVINWIEFVLGTTNTFAINNPPDYIEKNESFEPQSED